MTKARVLESGSNLNDTVSAGHSWDEVHGFDLMYAGDVNSVTKSVDAIYKCGLVSYMCHVVRSIVVVSGNAAVNYCILLVFG